jgi:hypothetical protein
VLLRGLGKMTRLLYVGQQVADDLRNNISENLARYEEGDFLDLEAAGDWRIPLSLNVDLGRLCELTHSRGAEDEVANSVLVGRVLSELTPTLARENRVWIRLSHVECLEYSRRRWLSARDCDDAELEGLVRKHFFAPTLTGCRDDHAVARLWWNYRIAKQIMPEDPERALRRVLALADIRQGLIERPSIGARPAIARGVVRVLERQKGLSDGKTFGAFMKVVNLMGAGVAFEVWRDSAIDSFMDDCAGEVLSSTKQNAVA